MTLHAAAAARTRKRRRYEHDESFERNAALARFFRTTYADFLLSFCVRNAVLVAFVAYLLIASYGCAHVQMGLETNDLLPDNSYGKRTLAVTQKYFAGQSTQRANRCHRS